MTQCLWFLGVHEWELKTFTKPTYCAVCHGLLVGLYRQGYSCKRCKINVHGKCVKFAQYCENRNPWLDYQDRMERQKKESDAQAAQIAAEKQAALSQAFKSKSKSNLLPKKKSSDGSFGDGDIWAEAMADADADADNAEGEDTRDSEEEGAGAAMPSAFAFM